MPSWLTFVIIGGLLWHRWRHRHRAGTYLLGRFLSAHGNGNVHCGAASAHRSRRRIRILPAWKRRCAGCPHSGRNYVLWNMGWCLLREPNGGTAAPSHLWPLCLRSWRVPRVWCLQTPRLALSGRLTFQPKPANVSSAVHLTVTVFYEQI